MIESKHLKVLIHDFSGHPFQIHLSRALAKRGYNVLHVYSASFQTPKGALEKRSDDPRRLQIVGIFQKKGFPKYSPIGRWAAESDYSKQLKKSFDAFRPDVVISSNAPLDIQRRLVRLCKKLGNIQFIFWVQDIYSIGMAHAFKKKLPILGALLSQYYFFLEKRLLRNSDHIVLIANDFKPIIHDWTQRKDITIVENWAPLDEIQPQPKKNPWAVSQSIADKFCLLYSGTLGMKHNPALLLELAIHYQHDEGVVIVVVSEGAGADWLKREAIQKNLNNLRFYDFFDYAQLPLVLSSADVLIAILDKMAGVFSVPSKVLSYHCIGRPLLLSIPHKNLASKIVLGAQSGFVVDPDDIAGFCACADQLKTNAQLRYEMGSNARQYAKQTFDIDKKCDSFIRVMR